MGLDRDGSRALAPIREKRRAKPRSGSTVHLACAEPRSAVATQFARDCLDLAAGSHFTS
jgi:hypothetical protein